MSDIQRSPEQEPVLHSILWFASSNAFRQLLGAVTAFLRPLLLSPEHFGIFSLLRALPMYAQRLHLGARTGLRYLTPRLEGRGQGQRVALLRGTVLRFSLVMNVLLALSLIGIAIFTSEMMIELRIGLVLTAGLALVTSLADHFTAELKGSQRFKLLSIGNYIAAVVLLAATVPLMLWHGLYGALIGQIIAMMVLLSWFMRKRIAGWRAGFSWRLLRSAVAIGLPTLLFDLALLMIRTADRILISQTQGFEQLGYYALGTMIVGYVLNIPGATREVMEGRLLLNLDRHTRADAFDQYALRPMVGMSFTLPWIIGPVYLLLPVAIEQALPHYSPGILAAQLLCLASWFLAVSYPLRGVLIANAWQVSALGILVPALALHVGLSWWWLSSGGGIELVSLSTGIAYLVVLTGTLAMVLIRIHALPKHLAFHGLLMVLLPLISFTLLWQLGRLQLTGNPWLDLSIQATGLLLYLIATAMVAVRLGVLPMALVRRMTKLIGRLMKRS